jgi:MinD superfamily P-loop ATPase
MEACKSCGRCGLRCPFEAIICGSGGRPELDASLCRGCGLCETGCSSDAIELLPITG